MRTRSFLFGVLVFIALLVGHGAQANEAARALDAIAADVERGARVFRSTGGCTCHTNYPGEGPNAPELAGGRAMETPFGVFYSTNITPDRETGIGEWSNENVRLLTFWLTGVVCEGTLYIYVTHISIRVNI